MNKIVFLGVAIGLLAIMTTPFIVTTVNASIIVPNDTGPDIPVVVDHLTQAQAALQNGDIEGANNHLELAKQSLQKGGNQSDSGQGP